MHARIRLLASEVATGLTSLTDATNWIERHIPTMQAQFHEVLQEIILELLRTTYGMTQSDRLHRTYFESQISEAHILAVLVARYDLEYTTAAERICLRSPHMVCLFHRRLQATLLERLKDLNPTSESGKQLTALLSTSRQDETDREGD